MDVEKTVEFLLEQNKNLTMQLARVATSQEMTNEILARLAERHVELTDQVSQMAKLHTEWHAETEHALNALISVVERHISDHKQI